MQLESILAIHRQSSACVNGRQLIPIKLLMFSITIFLINYMLHFIWMIIYYVNILLKTALCYKNIYVTNLNYIVHFISEIFYYVNILTKFSYFDVYNFERIHLYTQSHQRDDYFSSDSLLLKVDWWEQDFKKWNLVY